MGDTNQQIKQSVEKQLDRAKAFSDKVREKYRAAYEKAVGVGKGHFDDIVKAGGNIEPRIRTAIDNKIKTAHTVIDELNQSLADKTIPRVRRDKSKNQDSSSE